MSTATIKLGHLLNDNSNLSKKEMFSLLHTFTTNKAVKIVEKLCKGLSNKYRDADSIIRVSESYRSIGKINEALLVLKPKEIFSPGRFDKDNQKLKAHFAFIVNEMGASDLAYNILKSLNLNDPYFYRTRAEYACINFLFENAVEDYRLYFEKTTLSPEDYDYRLYKLCFADAVAYSGNTRLAKKMIMDLLEVSHEPQMKGMLFFCLGDYYEIEKKYEKSLKFLRKSNEFLLASKFSNDRAFLYTHLAICFGHLGDRGKSVKFFQMADECVSKPGKRAEQKVVLCIHKYRLGLISKEELNRALFFPGVPKRLYEYFKVPYTHEIYSFGSFQEARVKIYLNSNDYEFLNKSFYNISNELKFLSYLKIAGDWGIHVNRIKALFWPEQIYDYEFLENRIYQFISRVKKLYQLEIYKKDNMIYLKDEYNSVYVESGISNKPRFLTEFKEFNLSDLINFYSISQSKAKSLVREWKKDGIVATVGLGSKRRMIVKK